MTGSFLTSNLVDLLRASVLAGAYTWITWKVGRAILSRLGFAGTYGVSESFALGASALGFLWTLLAWAGCAYYPVIVILAILPAFFRINTPVPLHPGALGTGNLRAGLRNPIAFAAMLATASLVLYAVIQCAANIRGGDMDIYHLVIPRSILWRHEFVLNAFSHDAGFSYGWQLYALPAFFAGGEHCFVLMSAAAFVLLLLAIGEPIANRYGATTAWACILAVSFLLCGVARESLTNNDIPLMLIEVAGIRLALLAPGRAGAALGSMVGLLCGFMLAIKPQGLGTAFLLAIWLLFFSGGTLPAILAFAVGLSLLGLVWPLVSWLSYGSPIPQIMLLWAPSSGFLPQMKETMPVLMGNFAVWYRSNYARLFSQGMEGWTLLLCCIPLLGFRSARRDPAVRLLLGYAAARALILTLLSKGDMAIVFHDRYHLASYGALGMAAVLGVWHAAESSRVARAMWAQCAVAAAILLAAARLWLAPVQIVNPTGEPGGFRTEYWPSLASSAAAAMHSLAQQKGGGEYGMGSDWASEFLPADAVVATTAIDPYHLDRNFLQILPVSQNKIDLAGSPAAILASLRRVGATHLQLTQYSGLNLWMNAPVDKWLQSARKIPREPGVERLVWFLYPTDKGDQAFYRIDAGAQVDPAGAVPTTPVGAELLTSPDGTLWVNWKPIPYGEVEVSLVQAHASAASLGGTRAEYGRFPIRMLMPKTFTIRLAHRVDGRSSGSIDIPGLTAR